MSAIVTAGTRSVHRRSYRGTKALPAPTVADIQRFSLDNGPGIRSTVFLKGCDLRCTWCHNPELQEISSRISYHADRCIGCDACITACRNSPKILGPEDACSGCGRCASACPTGALRTVGTRMDPNRLAALLLEDLPFFRVSGGGVTFSGGEPALFGRYCADTARILKSHSVHIAMQTAGMFSWEEFASTILPLTDQIYFDLKVLDAAEHKRLTGCRPEPILENFRRLAASPVLLTATMVLVPGVNDDLRTIKAMRDFVHGCGVTRFVTRPYIADNGAKRRGIVTVPRRHRRDAVLLTDACMDAVPHG